MAMSLNKSANPWEQAFQNDDKILWDLLYFSVLKVP